MNVDEVLKHPCKPRMLRHYTGTLTDIRPKGDTYFFFDGLDRENDPNYLVYGSDRTRLYAVSSDAGQDGYSGCVNEYDLSQKKPVLLSHQPAYGNGPCYLTLSPEWFSVDMMAFLCYHKKGGYALLQALFHGSVHRQEETKNHL